MNLPTINELEARAIAAGISVKGLCDLTEIPLSTYYRWRSGEIAPALARYQAILDAVENAEREAAE